MAARDYDAELRALARLKADADESISRKLDVGIKVIRGIYGLILVVIALAVFLITIRNDVNTVARNLQTEKESREKDRTDQEEKRKADRSLLNQLYLKIYGVEVSFDQ